MALENVVNLDQLVIDTLNAVGEKMVERLNEMNVPFEHGKELSKYIAEGITAWADKYEYSPDSDEVDAVTILWCVITLVKAHVNYRDKSKDQ